MTASAAALLEVDGVSKAFKGLLALRDHTLRVSSGEIVGVIGPNGSGKSTLFNLITGFLRPTAGQIRFAGVVTGRLEPAHIARLGIARTFQGTRLFKSLSVFENVRAATQLRHPINLLEAISGLGRGAQSARQTDSSAWELLELVGLSARADVLAGSLPYGEQRLLEIARALGTQPRMLLMDEPAAGLDSTETAALLTLLQRIRDQFGVAVVVIEHDMDLIMNLCEKILVLAHGETICEGTPRAVQADPRVREAYLGTEHLETETLESESLKTEHLETEAGASRAHG